MPQSYETFSHLCPLVAQESALARPAVRRARDGSASATSERAIDMDPRLMPPATPRWRGRRSTHRCSPRPLGADHRRAGHVLREAIGAHPPLIVGRDPVHPVPSNPTKPSALTTVEWGWVPDDHDQFGAPNSRRPARPSRPGQLMIARSSQGGGIGHRRPGHEYRRGPRRTTRTGRPAMRLPPHAGGRPPATSPAAPRSDPTPWPASPPPPRPGRAAGDEPQIARPHSPPWPPIPPRPAEASVAAGSPQPPATAVEPGQPSQRGIAAVRGHPIKASQVAPSR